MVFWVLFHFLSIFDILSVFVICVCFCYLCIFLLFLFVFGMSVLGRNTRFYADGLAVSL